MTSCVQNRWLLHLTKITDDFMAKARLNFNLWESFNKVETKQKINFMFLWAQSCSIDQWTKDVFTKTTKFIIKLIYYMECASCHIACGRCRIVCASCHIACGRCRIVCGRCHIVCGRCHIVYGRCHIECGGCYMLCDICMSIVSGRCHLDEGRCHLGMPDIDYTLHLYSIIINILQIIRHKSYFCIEIHPAICIIVTSLFK